MHYISNLGESTLRQNNEDIKTGRKLNEEK